MPGPSDEWALLAEDPQAQSNYTLTQGLRPKFPFKRLALDPSAPPQQAQTTH